MRFSTEPFGRLAGFIAAWQIFDATGYQPLGAGSNDISACEISQAHPADLLNKPKFIIILRNNHRTKILKRPLKSL